MRRYGYIFLWLTLIPTVLFYHTPEAARFWCADVLPHLRSLLAELSFKAAFPFSSMLFLPLVFLCIFSLTSKGRTFRPFLAGFLVLSLSLTWLAPCSLSESIPAPNLTQLQNLCEVLSRQAARSKPPHGDFDPHNVLREASLLSGTSIIPKPAVSPFVAKALGLAGWWSPLTSEAIVDATMSELNLPFVACHELMHAKGIASEAHANYLAYAACMHGNDLFRYSGTMNALWYAMRSLRDADETAWNAVLSDMEKDVYTDFCRMNGLGEAVSSPLSSLQDMITQIYLLLSGADDYDAFAAWLVFSGNFA